GAVSRNRYRGPKPCLPSMAKRRAALAAMTLCHRADLDAQSDVQHRRRVGAGADRDEVNPGLCYRADRLEIDAARGLRDRPPRNDADGLRELIGRHVVEQHRIDAMLKRL